MVASTHWLASAAGMAVLERGGNAFDAAVATGFTLQVVEPHLNGPGGEVPAVFFPVARGEPVVLCGQGVAPAAATIERYRELGHELVPGTGVLAACVPGAFGRLAPAAGAVRHLAPRRRARVRDRLRRGRLPARRRRSARRSTAPRSCCRLARLRRALSPARPSSARSSATPRSPRPTGASSMSRAAARGEARDRARPRAPGTRASSPRRSTASSPPRAACSPARTWRAGARRSSRPRARLRRPARSARRCRGARPRRAAAARAARRASTWPSSRGVEHVHVVTECAKLAFADRDALYGDSAPVPLEPLLSPAYTTSGARSSVTTPRASCARAWRAPAASRAGRAAPPGAGEPTRGDTCHLDVADRFGNLVSATPSGGWLQSSPAIAGARVLPRHAGADVLARGGPARVAAPGRAAAHDAVAVAGAARRRDRPGVRHARRRSAGPVVAGVLPRPRDLRPRPAGGDRRADVPHDALPELVLLPAAAAPLRSSSRSASARTWSRTCAGAGTRSRSSAPGRSGA